jgi:signal transduction histidine kinase
MPAGVTRRAHRHGGVFTIAAVLLAGGFWILDAFLDASVFGASRPELWPHDAHELWSRLIVVTLLLGLGAYATVSLEKLARAERSSCRRERRVESLLATMTEGVILSAADGRILRCNQAAKRMLGIYSTPKGKACCEDPHRPCITRTGEPIPPEHLPGQRAVRGGGPITIPLMGIEGSDGSVTWVTASATPILDERGNVDSVISLLVDVTELKRSQDELRAAHATLEKRVAERSRRLMEKNRQVAVLKERERLARELHDAVTQTLFSISLVADSMPRLLESDPSEVLKNLDKLRRMARGALDEMRCLLLELRPAALQDAKLDKLLASIAAAVTERSGLPIDLDIDCCCAVDPGLGVALYRITQEALNNAARHSGAGRAQLRLRCHADRVELQVSDDGRGFDTERVPPDRLGLNIMRERAEASGAELTVESVPGQGTRVTAGWANSSRPPAAFEGTAGHTMAVQTASNMSRST